MTPPSMSGPAMNPRLSRILSILAAAATLAAKSPASAIAESVLQPTSWALPGGQAGAALGQSLAPAGDVDGDGYGDLIVGAPGYDTGQANAGAAFLYSGSAAGPGAMPAWSFLGTQTSAAFGTAVAPAGDINGDGFADFLVGAPLYNGNAGADQGRVDLFLGSATGPPLLPSQTLLISIAGGQFGAALAPAGDVNGDGYDDVVIGAPRTMETLVAEGAVYVFEGGPAGLSGPTWAKFGGAVAALLGYGVSGAGDVDADGFADVIVGAPGKSVNFTADGAAYVYRGSAAGLLTTASATLHGTSDSAAFGAAVSLAGDVDADGYADVLIGSPNRRVEGIAYGAASLYRGAPGGLGAALWQGFGTTAREFYGAAVATVGDLNGDGYPDFAVGADRWPTPGERRGRIEVYLGAANGPVLDNAFAGVDAAQALGAGLGTAGDLDGDGFSELAIGEPGATVDHAGEGRVTFRRGSASLPILATGWPFVDAETGAAAGIGIAGGVDAFGSMTSTLFFGARGADAGFTDAGSIRRAFPGYPFPTPDPSPVLTGHRAGALLGHTLARAGDIDGDRYEDLLAGSAQYMNGEGSEGVAQVFRGSGNGPVAPAAWSYEPNITGARVGYDLGAGDFNGDGYADVLVGALRDGNGSDDGFARAFYGSAAGLPVLPSWTTAPKTGNTFFGQFVAAGDWDGDSFTDAAVGAQYESNGESGEGRVYVYFGGPGGLEPNASWILERNLVSAQFGGALANGGDINGDGVSDLLVGAISANDLSHFDRSGEAWVIFGDRSRAQPLLRRSKMVLPDAPTISFGSTLVGVGDIDKDGYGDFLVAAPLYSNGQNNEGRVWLFRGSPAGVIETPWWSAESNIAESYFGFSLTAAGDINDDAWPDFVVGATNQPPGGAVYLYLGGGPATFKRVAQATINSALPLGGMLSTPNDLYVYHTVRTPAGRVKARPEFQVATQNEAWGGGTHAAFGPFDTGAPQPGTRGSSALYALPFPALTPGVAYRLRARNLPRSPYFPPTPWSQPRSLETEFPHFRVAGSVVDVAEPGMTSGPAFRAIEPSPFREGTRIRYRLSQAGVVALDVYDARGRHVRRLASCEQPAGDHDIAFDGRAIAAGVYFAVLELDGVRDVRKLVRLP